MVTPNRVPAQSSHASVQPDDSTQVIVGRVTDPNAAPSPGALVVVVGSDGAALASQNADSVGRFRLSVPAGRAVAVVVSTLSGGRRRIRLSLATRSSTTVNVGDVAVSNAHATLDTVRVAIARHRIPPPVRTDPTPLGNGVSNLNGVLNRLAPGSSNSLAALAATLPGVLLTGSAADPESLVILGLPGSLQSITLNGLPTAAEGIPLGMPMSLGVATSPADPSVGGFAGGEVQAEIAPGNGWSSRRLSASLMPVQQSSGLPTERTGSAAEVGALASGQIANGVAYYSAGLQLQQGSGSGVLPFAGLAPALRDTLKRAMVNVGIPLANRAMLPNERLFSGLLRVDAAPTGRRAIYGIAGLSESVASGVDRVPNDGPNAGASSVDRVSQAQLHAAFITGSFEHQVTSGIVDQSVSLRPYTTLPGLDVGVRGAAYPSANSVCQSVQCGVGTPDASSEAGGYYNLGGSVGNVISNSTTFQVGEKITRRARSRHHISFGADLRVNHDRSPALDVNPLGTFAFRDVQAFEDNAPTTFSRTVAPLVRGANQVLAAAYLSDVFRPHPELALELGGRGDIVRSGLQFADSQLEHLGAPVHDNSRSVDVSVSPRIAATWTYGSHAMPVSVSTGGIAANTGRSGSVRIAFGRYVAPLNNALISRLSSGADGTLVVQCSGVGVTPPNWTEWASTTQQLLGCGAGAGPSVSPRQATVERNYDVVNGRMAGPKSVRGSVGWSTMLSPTVSFDVNITRSRTRGLIDAVDDNRGMQPMFHVASEAGRPVWSPAQAFSSTGQLVSSAWKRDSTLGRVTSYSTSGQSRATQVAMTWESAAIASPVYWQFTYVYGKTESRQRGIGRPNDGDDRALAWSPSDYDARHQFTFQLGIHTRTGLYATLFSQLRSGLPFTPTVFGDPNGDGTLNDAAFVPVSHLVSDSVERSGVDDVLANGSSIARRCLTRLAGRLAPTNSCHGAWALTTTLDMSLPMSVLRLPTGSRLSLTLSDPIGAIDRLIHGDERHNWGLEPSSIDPTLLVVRGFDQSTHTFVYSVNPHFGRSMYPATLVQAAVTLQIPIGPSRDAQVVSSLLADADRQQDSPAIRAAEIVRRYRATEVDPIGLLIGAADTLGLTDAQLTRLRELRDGYQAAEDSVWTQLVERLQRAPLHNPERLLAQLQDALKEAFRQTRAIRVRVRTLLTPDQFRRLPALLRITLESELPVMVDTEG